MAKKKRKKPKVKQILYHNSTDPEEKLILIALREHASPKGWAVKSYGDLAKLTKLGESTVRDRIAKLLNRSILERTGREKPHDKTAYKIHLYNFLKDIEDPISEPISEADKAGIKYAEQLAKKMASVPIAGDTGNKPPEKQLIEAVAVNKLPHPSQPAKPQSEAE